MSISFFFRKDKIMYNVFLGTITSATMIDDPYKTFGGPLSSKCEYSMKHSEKLCDVFFVEKVGAYSVGDLVSITIETVENRRD